MDAVAFEDERVIEAMKRFVPVMVNCTKAGLTDPESFATNEEGKARMERYGVTGWPTFFVTAPDGAPLHRSNFASADGMLARLNEGAERWDDLSTALTWVAARNAEARSTDAAARARAKLELEHLIEKARAALPVEPKKEPATPAPKAK